MESSGKNNIDVARLLLANKADVNARDRPGETALAWAATKDHGHPIMRGTNVQGMSRAFGLQIGWIKKCGGKEKAKYYGLPK